MTIVPFFGAAAFARMRPSTLNAGFFSDVSLTLISPSTASPLMSRSTTGPSAAREPVTATIRASLAGATAGAFASSGIFQPTTAPLGRAG